MGVILVPQELINKFAMLWQEVYSNRLDRVLLLNVLKKYVRTGEDIPAGVATREYTTEEETTVRVSGCVTFILKKNQQNPDEIIVSDVVRTKRWRLGVASEITEQRNNLDLTKVVWTIHAIERFIARYSNDVVYFCEEEPVERKALKLLSLAVPEELPYKLERLRYVRNKGEASRYYRLGRYRFVLAEVTSSDGQLPRQEVRTFEVANPYDRLLQDTHKPKKRKQRLK